MRIAELLFARWSALTSLPGAKSCIGRSSYTSGIESMRPQSKSYDAINHSTGSFYATESFMLASHVLHFAFSSSNSRWYIEAIVSSNGLNVTPRSRLALDESIEGNLLRSVSPGVGKR